MKLLGPPKPKKPAASQEDFEHAVYAHGDPLLNPFFLAGYNRAKEEDRLQVENAMKRCAELERLMALSQPKPAVPKSRKLL